MFYVGLRIDIYLIDNLIENVIDGFRVDHAMTMFEVIESVIDNVIEK